MFYYKITSGLGPAECYIAVTDLFLKLSKLYSVELLQVTKSSIHDKNYDVYKEVLIKSSFNLSDFVGTIQYTFQSMLRPGHKRKNWFIKMYEYNSVDSIKIDTSKIEWITTKSSGPGGQHVNKTESCIVLKYFPLNIQIRCQSERSQQFNKQKALELLRLKISDMNEISKQNTQNMYRKCSIDIEHGNPVKSLTLSYF